MTTSYPGAIDSYTTKVNGVDVPDAAHVNNLQDAISAIETELGTNPSASAATVAARIATIEGKVLPVSAANDFLVGDGSGGWVKKSLAQTQVILQPYALISGVLHKQLWIAGWRPTMTNGCASPAQIEMTTNKNVYDYLAFDQTTIEYAYANVPMPQDYTGGTVYAKVYWMHPAGATAYGISWGLQAVAIGNDEALDVVMGTAGYINDTGGTDSKLYISDMSLAITIAGTPSAGELINWRIMRKADNATYDTLNVDGYLIGVMIWYPVR